MFSYRDVLINYGVILNEAPTKKKGLVLVKADWKTKKQQVKDPLDIDIIDLGIEIMAISRKRFDMEKFLETGLLPIGTNYSVNGLDEVISLFLILEAIKKDPEIKECLDKIMGIWSENLGSMTIFNRETFLNEVMNNITDLKSWTLQELFDYYLSSIFDFDLGELLGFDSILTDKEFDIWKDFSNQHSITITMRYMYLDLYDRIKHSVFDDSVK